MVAGDRGTVRMGVNAIIIVTVRKRHVTAVRVARPGTAMDNVLQVTVGEEVLAYHISVSGQNCSLL